MRYNSSCRNKTHSIESMPSIQRNLINKKSEILYPHQIKNQITPTQHTQQNVMTCLYFDEDEQTSQLEQIKKILYNKQFRQTSNKANSSKQQNTSRQLIQRLSHHDSKQKKLQYMLRQAKDNENITNNTMNNLRSLKNGKNNLCSLKLFNKPLKSYENLLSESKFESSICLQIKQIINQEFTEMNKQMSDKDLQIQQLQSQINEYQFVIMQAKKQIVKLNSYNDQKEKEMYRKMMKLLQVNKEITKNLDNSNSKLKQSQEQLKVLELDNYQLKSQLNKLNIKFAIINEKLKFTSQKRTYSSSFKSQRLQTQQTKVSSNNINMLDKKYVLNTKLTQRSQQISEHRKINTKQWKQIDKIQQLFNKFHLKDE